MRFGVTFLPPDPVSLIGWVRCAEAEGFDPVGIADSQSVYRELYVAATLCAVHTARARFGPRVTNPITRHPAVTASAMATLEELAPGRTILGLGTGDSAVAAVGRGGTTLARLREYVTAVRGLMAGQEVAYEGRRMRLTWAKARVPIYLSAHGPRGLELAGEIADGVIIGTGVLPEIVADAREHVRIGAARAGRRLEDLDLWWWLMSSLAPTREAAVADAASGLAAAGNHLLRFTASGKHVPPELVEPLRQLRAGYRVEAHFGHGAAEHNARLVRDLGLTEYLVARFGLLGTPEECVARARALEALGVTQVWLPQAFADKLGFMRAWSRRVMQEAA
jgi:5,10-methylenetetrahydromethanopterin reductase